MVGIQGALQDDPLFNMPTNIREPSFEMLVSSQNDVGWSHLLRGRFSHHWVQIQQDPIDREDEVSSKKLTGQRWLKQVLHHLWTHLCLAWKLRNADLHGVAAADQEEKRKAKLQPNVVALCADADKLLCLDKRLFEMPIELRLLTQSHDQSAWIHLVAPTVRTAQAEADKHLRTTQPDIRSCFVRPVAQPAIPRPLAVQIHERRPIPRL
jgi:hypothetical protein